MMGAVVPRHIAFWAKAEYFNGTGVSGWAFKKLMHGLGAIEVNREGGRAALTALDAAVPALRAGDLVGVYPEGTRSPDGRLYRGRTGAARLALLAEVPIIPVGVLGTEAVQPIGTKVPKLGPKVTVRFGKPMDFTGRPMDSSSLRAITDERDGRDPGADRPGVRRPVRSPPPAIRGLTGRHGDPTPWVDRWLIAADESASVRM